MWGATLTQSLRSGQAGEGYWERGVLGGEGAVGGGVISWEPLPDRDCRGMWGLTTRNLIVTEKVTRLPTPGTRISAD